MVKTKKATTSDMPPIDIGIKEADHAGIAEGLSRLLADTYTLYRATTSTGTSPDPCSTPCT